MKIAAYTNSADGSGARRVYFEFIKRLKEKGYEIDLYHLSYARMSSFPLSNYVNKIYSYKMREIKESRLKPYLLSLLLNFFRKIPFLIRLKYLSKRMSNDMNSRNYDVAFFDVCDLLRVSYHFRYLKIPSLLFLQHPKREAFEPVHFMVSKLSYEGYPFLIKIYKKLSVFVYKLDNMLIGRISKLNSQFASLILTNSYYTREYIYKVYGVLAKVNYLGIDLDKFKPLRLKRKNFVLSVGGIEETKGFDHIIRALSLIPEGKRPDLMIVAGRKNQGIYDYLVQLAREKNISMTILEKISDDELVRLYNEALMIVFVPLMEPFGLIPLESNACGTPIIGIREGGIRESIIDGETGILVDRDEQELVQAITKLIDSQEMREKLSQNGVEYVRKYWTWEKSTALLEKYFQMAIKNSRD
jgi:glycosyltransferase involved in cell wall biosynthesis